MPLTAAAFLALAALCLLGPMTTSGARYQPGEAGGPWSPEEVDIVRQKVIQLMDQNNYVENGQMENGTEWVSHILPGLEKKPGKRPSENKVLRLAFHDCLRYDDGSGGCDGCLNWKNMGTYYERKPPQGSRYEPVNETDNNDLAVTLMALEKIYTELDWPPNTPALTTSLIDSGKSRADLWAFAALVALEQAIERANYACDHDTPRHQIGLLEGRDACDIKLHRPIKFRYGRRDCLVSDPAHLPYNATKHEVHPNPFGNGETFVTFMEAQFGIEAKEAIALMGIHSVVQHVKSVQATLATFKYGWVGSPYLSNMFYKRLAMLPVYRPWPRPSIRARADRKGEDPPTSFTGDAAGAPVDGYGWRAMRKKQFDGPDGGPFAFRPVDVACRENPSSAELLRLSCTDGRDENGDWKIKASKCCRNATIDERGVQTGGGCQAGNKCNFDVQFALNIEMGFVYNFTFDEYGKAGGCPALDTPPSEWNVSPIYGSPIVDCPKTTLAPQGEALSEIVEDFGNDHDLWIRSFLDGWTKMQANNYEDGDLVDGPQNSWLGYESLKGRYDFEDYEDFINSHAPFSFTRSDVNPFICGECWLRFNGPYSSVV